MAEYSGTPDRVERFGSESGRLLDSVTRTSRTLNMPEPDGIDTVEGAQAIVSEEVKRSRDILDRLYQRKEKLMAELANVDNGIQIWTDIHEGMAKIYNAFTTEDGSSH